MRKSSATDLVGSRLSGSWKKVFTPTQLFAAAVDNLGMKRKQKKKRRRIRSAFIPFRRRRPFPNRTPAAQPSDGIAVETGGRRIVAITLAQEAARGVSASPEERERLIAVAFSIGQWLADEGFPGEWDRVKPAAIMRCLDFLPPVEQDHFLFSFVGLLGHGALTGQISWQSARRSLEEIAGLTEAEPVRTFARTTAAQLQPRMPS